MTLSSHHQQREFSQWLKARRARSREGGPLSIVISSPCLVCQPRIAESVAKYLNEFDEQSDGSTWLFLDDERRELMRDNIQFDRSILSSRNFHKEDFNQFLLSCGNIVIESSTFVIPDPDSKDIFQVHLSCKEPEEDGHHLWLNAKKIAPETLTLMIANSFIDWAASDKSWVSDHQQETV